MDNKRIISEYSEKTLVKRNELTYFVNEDTPFSGICKYHGWTDFDLEFKDGLLVKEIFYKNKNISKTNIYENEEIKICFGSYHKNGQSKTCTIFSNEGKRTTFIYFEGLKNSFEKKFL